MNMHMSAGKQHETDKTIVAMIYIISIVKL